MYVYRTLFVLVRKLLLLKPVYSFTWAKKDFSICLSLLNFLGIEIFGGSNIILGVAFGVGLDNEPASDLLSLVIVKVVDP